MRSTVESKHRRDHLPRIEIDKRTAVEIADCWYCQRAYAHCRSKVRYAEWRAAFDYAQSINVTTDWQRMLVPYRCRCCQEYHLTSSKAGTSRNKRVERRRRRWVVAQLTSGSSSTGSSEV